MSHKPLVAVVISSRTDFNVMRRGLETLRVMGVPYIFDVMSPHRSPAKIQDFAQSAGPQGLEVIIAAAGGSPLLATHIASYTNLPVIGVPIDASPLRGQDALYALAMVPPGMPVATVGINNAENAAVLATQILALKHPQFRTVLAHRHMSAAQRSEVLQKELQSEYPDLCQIERTSINTIAALTENDTEPGDLSETPTPDPNVNQGPGARIQPGAIYAEKGTGAEAESLVSTPVPQEPGSANKPVRQTRPAPATAEESATPVKVREMKRSSKAASKAESAESAAQAEGAKDPTPGPTQPAVLKTKVFKVDREHPSEDLIDHVMMTLLEGGVVGIPTDTVYGLAADGTNKEAIDRLRKLKGREQQRTLGVLIHHPDMLDQLVREVPPALDVVVEAFWPGGLTIVLPKKAGVLSNAAKSDRIGIRLPSDPVCLAVIQRIGRPIVMRNASIESDKPMTNAAGVIEHYSGHIDCILDAGECPNGGGASTVLSVNGDQFEILREGGISRDQLKAVLGDRLK